MVLERMLWCVTCPNHASFHFLTVAITDSCGPIWKMIVLCTSALFLCSESEMRRSFLRYFDRVSVCYHIKRLSQFQLSQLAEPLWTDPDTKSGISVLELISTLRKKRKKMRVRNNSRTFSQNPNKGGKSPPKCYWLRLSYHCLYTTCQCNNKGNNNKNNDHFYAPNLDKKP